MQATAQCRDCQLTVPLLQTTEDVATTECVCLDCFDTPLLFWSSIDPKSEAIFDAEDDEDLEEEEEYHPPPLY